MQKSVWQSRIEIIGTEAVKKRMRGLNQNKNQNNEEGNQTREEKH